MSSSYDCNSTFGYPYIVDLYAKVGLHRYNMSEGTNLQLVRVIKYKSSMNYEDKPSSFGLTVSLARPNGYLPIHVPERSTVASISTTRSTEVSLFSPGASSFSTGPSLFAPVSIFRPPPASTLLTSSLSGLPGMLSPIATGFTCWRKQSCETMIGLLYICNFKLRYLVSIMYPKPLLKRRAIESMNKEVEPRNAKSAFVYITFKGFAIRGMSEDFERKAIIRRVIDERTGSLSLLGGFSGEDHTLGYNPNMTTLESFEFVKNAVRTGTVPFSERDKCLYTSYISNTTTNDNTT
ncbi:unnamed protein product [Arabis nemorensis]|uniref:Uncharacterized protein n=1 Tax=Arabis nemorensis TaxID=586526 RepID=A0A565CHB1_9BRAS|nr:unnamed protein product [Arabis nemorensis]